MHAQIACQCHYWRSFPPTLYLHIRRFDKAVAQVFGQTLLCRNLDVATNVARALDVDTVTLDGDQVRGVSGEEWMGV
jgi:chromosome segregation ATPase